MILAIVEKTGTVHQYQYGASCPTVRRYQGEPVKVTPLQALVYKLPRCGDCWPRAADYDRHIGRRAA